MGRGKSLKDAFHFIMGERRGSSREDIQVTSDESVVSYQELEMAGDEELDFFIKEDTGMSPNNCIFISGHVQISTMRYQSAAESPEDFLSDGNEAGYEKIMEMIELYEDQGKDALPPIVYWVDEAGNNKILDGRCRLLAARFSGQNELPSYHLIT